MKGLAVILTILLSFNTASAHFWTSYSEAELSNEALIGQIEAIADELESNDHGQRVLNMAYNRSRVIRKKLDRSLERLPRLKDATDEDIMPLLQDMITSIDTKEHRKLIRVLVRRHLDKILTRLIKLREEVTEIAVLNVDDSSTLDFGFIFTGTNSARTFTITNSGNGPAMVTGETGMVAPFDFRSGSYPGLTGTCGTVILAGETCSIELDFTPQVVGVFSGTFVLEYNDGVNSQTVVRDLTGQAN